MLTKLERWAFITSRLTTLVAVVASWLGALLMFILGMIHTYDGFAVMLSEPGAARAEGGLPRGAAAVLNLIEALDRFLIAVVLLYFGYGLYALFVKPGRAPSELGLPEWLHVESIGELKRTVAEVILVILFVLFLRVALEAFYTGGATATLASAAQFLVLPISILLLAAALRLAELHTRRR